MAITFVGRGYTNGNGNATLTITFGTTNWSGSTPQAGDIVVATMMRSNSSSTGAFTINTSGYTSLTPNPISSAGTGIAHTLASCAYKIMGSTPDSSISISLGGSSTYEGIVGVTIFRNVSSSNPKDVTSTYAVTTSSSQNPSSITTQTDGCMIIAVSAVSNDSNRSINGAPSGYTLSFGNKYFNQNFAGLGVAYKLQTSAGTETPGSFNESVTSSNDERVWQTVALRLAVSAPANVKTINGLAIASVKTVNGLEIASVKTVNGLA